MSVCPPVPHSAHGRARHDCAQPNFPDPWEAAAGSREGKPWVPGSRQQQCSSSWDVCLHHVAISNAMSCLTGSDPHTVVHLRPVPRGPLWGVAGGHLPWGEQLTGPGTVLAFGWGREQGWERGWVSGSRPHCAVPTEVPAAAVEHHLADCPAALHRRHGAGPAPVAAGPVGAGCRGGNVGVSLLCAVLGAVGWALTLGCAPTAGPEAAHPAAAVGTENPAVPSREAASDTGL